MARYKPEKIQETPTPVVVEPVIIQPVIIAPVSYEPIYTIHEYCANFAQHPRNIDKAIKNWFVKTNSISDKKTIAEWRQIIDNFLNEKE